MPTQSSASSAFQLLKIQARPRLAPVFLFAVHGLTLNSVLGGLSWCGFREVAAACLNMRQDFCSWPKANRARFCGTGCAGSGNREAEPTCQQHVGTRVNLGLCFFYRVSSFVFVGGGAWASHTPESYPEPSPRAIPRVIPL